MSLSACTLHQELQVAPARRSAPETISPLEKIIDQIMSKECEIFASSVRRADHLTSSEKKLDMTYYLRHRIETVRRIWETARTDALALAAMTRENYSAARKWAEYATEEMGHDRLYLADLERHGISKLQVANTPPFASTQLMLQYLEQQIFQLGSLPAVAYSLYVEWNSARASPLVVARVASALGSDLVKGAHAHIGIDEAEDHAALIVEIAAAVMQARGYSAAMLQHLLCVIGAFFRAYFQELDVFAAQYAKA